MTTSAIKGYECKFVVHIPSRHSDIKDYHIVKERIHYEDGTTKPRLKTIADFKRPFWVTKPSCRKHKQKKEWEKEENLVVRYSTQSDLRHNVAKALDKGWCKDHLKKLAESPYLYGTDISSGTFIKQAYSVKYPDLASAYSVAAFDIETDVVNGTNEAVMASLVFENIAFIAVQKSFISGISMLQDRFQSIAKKYIGEYLEKHNMTIELYIAEDVVDLIKAVFKKAHELQPDFLAIWNMDFDIPQILRMLSENGVDPKEILCDPRIPSDFRVCKYRPGPEKKTTASGKVIPINPAARWHTFDLTASFYVIDAMCAYKHIRLGRQEEPSYSLDSILNKELGIRKLKFEEADAYTGLQWHQFMQVNYKLEYMVYNIFDSLSMLELDAKTKDLCFTLPSFSGNSDFANFKSQPKRIVDALFFFCKDNKGHILASCGPAEKKSEDPKETNDDTEVETEDVEDTEEDTEELTYSTLGLKGWIVTLPAMMTVLGEACISEDSSMRTGIRFFVYDSDSVSAYPTCTSIANVSKSTTKRELIDIENIDPDIFKMQNLNLVLGEVNAIEYTTTMFNMPKPHELLDYYISRK